MSVVIAIVCSLLAALAVRGTRWAYLVFVICGLAYFPLQAGFQSLRCQFLFDRHLALFSFTNYAHIVLFAIFFLISYAHFRARQTSRGRALAVAVTATIVMGALVELAQGVSGHHNCRLRDLIPDTAGALLGALLVAGGHMVKGRERSPTSAAS